LEYSDLSDANLTDANLSEADLSNTKMINAELLGADISDAVLRNADLTNARLYGALMRDADLRNADLTNAWFFDSELESQVIANLDAIERATREPTPLVPDKRGRVVLKMHGDPHHNQPMPGDVSLQATLRIAPGVPAYTCRQITEARWSKPPHWHPGFADDCPIAARRFHYPSR
jgi:hypothetical protein